MIDPVIPGVNYDLGVDKINPETHAQQMQLPIFTQYQVHHLIWIVQLQVGGTGHESA